MRQTTLSELRTRVREKADIEGYTDRHTDAQLNKYINNSWRKLYSKLAAAFLLKNTITQVLTASGAYSYTLPDDFAFMYGVYEEIDTEHRPLGTHPAGVRPFGRPGPSGAASTYALSERDDDHYMEFYPQPDSGTYVYVYVPEPNTLSADGDNINGALNYDEYVVLDAAYQVLERDDLPRKEIKQEVLLIEQTIRDAQQARDLLGSTHIRDVRTARFDSDEPTGAYRPVNWRTPWRRY